MECPDCVSRTDQGSVTCLTDLADCRSSPAELPHHDAVTDRDPLELRVLGTLRTGVESPSTVSSRLGVAREDVATALERAVVDGLATRLDLAGTPVYALTTAGLGLVGEDVPATPVDLAGVSDSRPDAEVWTTEVPTADATPGPEVHATAEVGPVREVPEVPTVAAPPQRQEVRRGRERSSSGRVAWRHVVYAAAYVVLGLAFLVLLHAWVGLLAVVGGLVLGVFALRPLLRGAEAPGHD